MAFRLVIALAALVACGAHASEIYKWVDEDGRVHYGDRPPEGEGKAIELDSSATGVDLAPMAEEWQTPVQAPGEAATARPAEPSMGTMEERFSCFGSLESALGPQSALLTGDATVPLLTKAEQERVVELLESMTGHWSAEVTETECLGSPEQPKAKQLHAEARPEIDWPFRGPWRLQATLEGSESRGVISRTLWLQVEDDKLFFGTTDTTQTTQERSRVVPLSAGQDHLSWGRWYRQPSAAGATITRTEIKTLRAARDSLHLIEVFYTQGQLSSRRIWDFAR